MNLIAVTDQEEAAMPDPTEGDFWVVLSNGDSAEADDLDSAVYAATTLLREGHAGGTYYTRLTAAIYLDGFLLRGSLTLSDLSIALVAAK